MGYIPFQKIHWPSIESVEHTGIFGFALWRTVQVGELRIRVVELSNEYLADHWCQKGHIVHCLEGQFTTELGTGEEIELAEGETYLVSDDLSSHRSFSQSGAKLLVIDGDFLK